MSQDGSMNSAVARSLLDSAKHQAARALDAFAADPRDARTAYLAAGLALEHLAKTVLATLNETLIADPRHFESQYLLAAKPDSFEAVAPRLRTISLTEALERASRLAPEVHPLLQPLGRPINQRNAVAHVGLAFGDHLVEDLGVLLRAMSAMLDHLDYPREMFFGEYLEAVERRMSESVDELEADVQDRLVRARREFQDRWGDAPAELDLGPGLHLADLRDLESATPLECPACGTEAVAFGAVDIDVEVDVDHREGVITGAYPVPFFEADEFICRACGLRLRSHEFQSAGLPSRWLLDDYEIDERAFWGHDDMYEDEYR